MIFAGLFSGCSVKKYIKPDEYLIGKYTLQIDDKKAGLNSSELKSFFRPKKNARLLGSHWKLSNYYKALEKPTKFNKWKNKNFGEYPAFYDEPLAIRIKQKMQKYLDNVGYFHSTVTYDIEFVNRIAKLHYLVKPAQPYRISEISYDIADTVLAGFFNDKVQK